MTNREGRDLWVAEMRVGLGRVVGRIGRWEEGEAGW